MVATNSPQVTQLNIKEILSLSFFLSLSTNLFFTIFVNETVLRKLLIRNVFTHWNNFKNFFPSQQKKNEIRRKERWLKMSFFFINGDTFVLNAIAIESNQH